MRLNLLSKTSIALGLLALSVTANALADEELPNLSLNIDQVTLSGLSSGGYMANQMHLAYSEWVSGVGIIAAGPYDCAQNSLFTALASCINKTEPPADIAKLNDMIKALSSEGKLGNLEALKDDKVWLLSGTQDTRVIQAVVDGLDQQYRTLVKSDNVTYIKDKAFAHHFPTASRGSDCSQSEAPFVGSCNYDAAGKILEHLSSDLNTKTSAVDKNLFAFSQQALAGESAKTLGDTGYLYIPTSCQQGQTCQLHINFHGCNQYADAVGTDYVTQNGLNDWAESNNLVVLYPQTKKSAFNPLNPQGCWDWWGYTDENYATRDGQQIQAVRNMALALVEKK
ncbi:polyhydroxybutyrate depolymerase [Alteromonadaceae bacterium M269]|nr:polyhydroxybutyrate depolymerase [Alteromonadaceae bacterium M269]